MLHSKTGLLDSSMAACSGAQFVLADISQPSCSVMDSWQRPLRRLLRQPHQLPFLHAITAVAAASTSSSTIVASSTISPVSRTSSESDSRRGGDSGASTEGGSSSAVAWTHEEDIAFLSDADDWINDSSTSTASLEEPLHHDEQQEDGMSSDNKWSGVCQVAPMSDSELEYVEWAHVHSRFLEIYSEPCLRFVSIPPTAIAFCTPYVPRESGYHSESSPPLNTGDCGQKTNGVSAAVTSGSAIGSTKAIDTNKSTASSSSSAPPVVSAWATRSPLSVAKAKQSQSAAAAASSSSSTNSAASATQQSAQSQSPKKAASVAPCPPPASPLNNQGHFEVSKMDVLSEEIWHYHNSVTQTESMLSRKLHLRDRLYYAICPVFPMCGLYVVGSSLNGFGNNSSDMDLCLMITNKDLDQKTDAVVVLNMILSTLSSLDCVAQQKLILAKVPILRIKFAAPFDDITVDLNANNSVAIKNTHLLCYYSLFDWRVRPLVSVVKEWAKRKGINDANRSSFTSYSLVLMVIHYLQCGADQPVLPTLQQMFPKRFATKCDVRTLSVTTPLPPAPEDWRFSEKATLGELLIGFLDYYANKFDYNRDAISVRQGKRVDRAVMARNRPHGQSNNGPWRSQWRCICIEEPFTLSNTAHSIYDEMVFNAIKGSLQEAHELLEKTRDLKTLLDCKPITVNAPVGGAVVYAATYEGPSRNPVLSLDSSVSPPLPTASSTVGTGSPSPSARGSSGSSSSGLSTAVSRTGSNSTAGSSASSCSSSSNGDVEPDAERLLDIRCSVMAQLERGMSSSSQAPPPPQQLPRSSGGRRRTQQRKPWAVAPRADTH